MPFISICIPAYKNPGYLERLLQSISTQHFKDFEVIITDDSPDESLIPIVNAYRAFIEISYIKNPHALGTPANWNFAIAKAKGQWIKLMHNDDWFAGDSSLEIFADVASKNNTDFIFSGFTEIKPDAEQKEYILSAIEKTFLQKSPLNLFKKNFIGHPSTTLVRNNRQRWYDENVKWVVDFEFYIRCLQHTNFICIKQPLVNIGVHDAQVTKSAFRNPDIEIPEGLYLINKLGEISLRNIFVYDYYWRLFRNLKIRNSGQLNAYAKGNAIPLTIKKMVDFQLKIPLAVLNVGIFSKSLMTMSKLFAR